jgi:hypothetical protein
LEHQGSWESLGEWCIEGLHGFLSEEGCPYEKLVPKANIHALGEKICLRLF